MASMWSFIILSYRIMFVFKPRASYVLGRHLKTDLYPQPYFLTILCSNRAKKKERGRSWLMVFTLLCVSFVDATKNASFRRKDIHTASAFQERL